MAHGREWGWVRRLAHAVTRDAASARDPAASVVDPALVGRLGVETMRQADTPAHFGKGLILVLLALVPALRSKALCSLRTDDLTSVGDGYHLTIRAKTKKGKRRTHTVPLPAEATPYIDLWLHRHRRALVDSAKPIDTLMLTGAGNPYQRATLWRTVADLTEKGIGVRIGPHRIRHCAATWVAIHAPEHVMEIRHILDHAAARTSQDHYNLAGSLDASRRFNATMLDLMDPSES